MKQLHYLLIAFISIGIASFTTFASDNPIPKSKSDNPGFEFSPYQIQQTSLVDIPAMKDNTLFEDTAGALSNGSGSHFFVGKSGLATQNIRRGVIAFDVAGNVPSGAVITNVTLRLNMSKTISGAQSTSLHKLTSDWGEGTSDAAGAEGGGAASTPTDATWIHTSFSSSLWTTPGGDFVVGASETKSVSGIGFYTFGSTTQMVADVQDWLDNPANNFGWIIIGNESMLSTAKRFDTKENAIAANRPKLTVNFDVPPPPVPTLFPFILDDDQAADCAGTGTGAGGFGLAILSPDSSNLSFFIAHNVDSLTDAHVHKAVPCVSGAIAFAFSSPTSPISEGWSLSLSDVDALYAGSLYVNIHSSSFPGGEIRGQIIPEPIRFIFTLDESQANAGVGTGSFAAGCAVVTLSSDGSQLSINVEHDVENTSDGHVHLGAPGVSGSIVFPFADGISPVTEVWTLDTSDIKDLYLGDLYINIHSTAFTGGEIRGQIERQAISLIAQLNESQANAGGGTGSAAKGFGLFTLSADQKQLDTYVEHDVITTNDAHIHIGFPGFDGPIEFPFSSFTSPIVETWDSLTFSNVSTLLDGNYYVNIHSDSFPSGEIRGQIEKRQIQHKFQLSDSLAAACAGTGTGASGTAETFLKPGAKELTIDITHDVAPTVTDGHIHRAFPCINGPVVFPFSSPTSPISEIWYLSTSDVIDLLQGELYVNIHSSTFPAGEIRGQIESCCQGNRGDLNNDGTDSNILDFIREGCFNSAQYLT
jgi:hypothetical protein